MPHLDPGVAAWLLLACVVALIAANALFVAVEFSYLTVDRSRLERAAQAGDTRARGIQQHLRMLSRHLSGAQLGITVTSLLVGFIAEPSIATLLRPGLEAAGLDRTATVGLSLTLALVIATFVQMVFGELVPKNWGIAQPMRVARLVHGPQHLFMLVCGGFVRLLDGGANAVVRMLGFEPRDELASARTADELHAVVRHSGRSGTLDRVTAELLARAIEFGNHTAADVMRPRTRVEFVDGDAPAQEVLRAAVRTGRSRFPVLGQDVDDVLGVVHVKHVLAVPYEERESRPVHEVAVPALVVPESMTLDPLMRRLREPGLQFAVVVDEYGGTAGIVSLEDLVEEIVGEIDDEHDPRTRPYRRRGDGWEVSGLLRPDELGDVVGLRLPEGEETDTLGGLLTERLDRLPEAGDVVTLDAVDEENRDDEGVPTAAKVELRVTRMAGHRVDRVEVRTSRPHGPVATAHLPQGGEPR